MDGMGAPSHYWFVLALGTLASVCCLCWKTSVTLSSPSVLAKASIQVDLSLPTASLITHQLFSNVSRRQSAHRPKKKLQQAGPVSRFMIQLYNRRPDADIVRALNPAHVTSATAQNSRILEYVIPEFDQEELESAELLGTLGTILRVSSMDRRILSDVGRSRMDESWRAFDVTSEVRERKSGSVRFFVRIRTPKGARGVRDPILVLSYAKPKIRRSRAVHEEEREDAASAPWVEEGGRRLRRRNLCRRRPLYVDFASIAYNEWIVAPPGYEAYQCVGKCFYPFGDHLSPTKHAIIQTLVHGALQEVEGKSVGRACCVPTRLAPTSLLYIDASGTLTYQYGYEDMVVAECGCR